MIIGQPESLLADSCSFRCPSVIKLSIFLISGYVNFLESLKGKADNSGLQEVFHQDFVSSRPFYWLSFVAAMSAEELISRHLSLIGFKFLTDLKQHQQVDFFEWIFLASEEVDKIRTLF
ncbi:MAG: hypothetical protein ACKO0V_00260 [bacterium]